MLYNYKILFTQIVIFLSLCIKGGGVSVEELKKFSGNPKHYEPCSSSGPKPEEGSVSQRIDSESCGDKICKVWHKLFELDPFVKKGWTSIFAKSLKVDKDIKGRSPMFLFYLAMWIYHRDNSGECEKFIEPQDIKDKTFEELIESLAVWWTASLQLRVKTNRLLDSESLKLYKFIGETNLDKKKYLFKVKLAHSQRPPVIDTTFGTDCGKFMNKIFQGYGKFTRHSKCQYKKWKVLQAAADRLNWSSKGDEADPEELCSPEMKAALEYEVKRMTKFENTNCYRSLENLQNVIDEKTKCCVDRGGRLRIYDG